MQQRKGGTNVEGESKHLLSISQDFIRVYVFEKNLRKCTFQFLLLIACIYREKSHQKSCIFYKNLKNLQNLNILKGPNNLHKILEIPKNSQRNPKIVVALKHPTNQGVKKVSSNANVKNL